MRQSEKSFIPQIVEAAARVTEGELRWQTVAQHSPIAMCLVAADGTFLDVNPAACRLFERDEKDIIGSRWQDYTHENDIEEDKQNVERVIHEENVDHYQFLKRYYMPDRRIKKCLLKVASVSDNEDVFCYFISLIVDLESMKQMLTLAEHIFEARDKNAS